MRRQAIIGVFVGAILALLAQEAAAQPACFTDQETGSRYRLDVGGATGPSGFLLGGIVVSSSGQTFPISGVARLRLEDGVAQIGVTIHSSDATNFPSVGQFFLNPPNFNQGNGTLDSLGGGFQSLTFSPAGCLLP
jgi:hypothetical protein